MDPTQFLNEILQAFQGVLGPGRQALYAPANSLLYKLAGINLTLAGLWWAARGENFIGPFFRKSLFLCVFLWFVSNYDWFMSIIMDGFISVASITSQRNVASFIRDPSAILVEGFRVVEPAVNHLTSTSAWGLLDVDALILAFTLLVSILSFGLLSITVLVTWIEYYLLTAIALVFVPFGAFSHTSFLAERAFGLAISFGVKICVLGVVIAIAGPVLFQLQVSNQGAWFEMFGVMIGSLAVAILAIHAPSLAAGLLSGSPSLSAGAALGATAAVAGAAGGAGMLTAKAGGAVATKALSTGAHTTMAAAGKVAGVGGEAISAGSRASGGTAASIAAGSKAMVGAGGRAVMQGFEQIGGAADSKVVHPLSGRVQEIGKGLSQSFGVSRERVRNPYPLTVPKDSDSGNTKGKRANTSKEAQSESKRKTGQTVKNTGRSIMNAARSETRPDTGLAVPVKE